MYKNINKYTNSLLRNVLNRLQRIANINYLCYHRIAEYFCINGDCSYLNHNLLNCVLNRNPTKLSWFYVSKNFETTTYQYVKELNAKIIFNINNNKYYFI